MRRHNYCVLRHIWKLSCALLSWLTFAQSNKMWVHWKQMWIFLQFSTVAGLHPSRWSFLLHVFIHILCIGLLLLKFVHQQQEHSSALQLCDSCAIPQCREFYDTQNWLLLLGFYFATERLWQHCQKDTLSPTWLRVALNSFQVHNKRCGVFVFSACYL